MSTPSIPNPKAPPRHMQDAARRVRAERKACHGTVHTHGCPCCCNEENK